MYSHSTYERVKDKLSLFSNTSECWEWPMSKTKAGYGQLPYRVDNSTKLAYAHRASFEIANGPIPDGMCVCHTCDNPGCFNPDHLFLGSHQQNMEDMASKGRTKKGKSYPLGDAHWAKGRRREVQGSNNGNSKLEESDVVEILRSSDKNVRLAERFGVSQTIISMIKKRKVWTHVSLSV